jgi:threonine synthase
MTKNPYYDYEFVPFSPRNLEEFSLGEGTTSLTKAVNLGRLTGYSNLYIKHEEQNPTGSFKDRESLIAVSLAKYRGLDEVVIASSGNAALSMAAYARKAQLTCICVVPESTSAEKKELVKLFGGTLIEMEGNYEVVYRHVADTFDRAMNMTSGICSERVEGNKTIAFEISKEIGAPDVVVVPCGNGGNLAGIWRGFWELEKMAKIPKVPRIIGVQVAGADPVAMALKSGGFIHSLKNVADSLAEGIVAEESYCSPKAVMAICESGGSVISVTDQEVVQALKQIVNSESLMIEPTAAAAFAAVPRLSELNIPKDAKIVIVSTGSGMKMLNEVKSYVLAT